MKVFHTVLKKFDDMGEKTGWTYIEILPAQAEVLFPGNKKSFRVKGCIDDVEVEKTALLPMGDGNFIMAVNSGLRKKLKKIHGATVSVKLERDTADLVLNKNLVACLKDEPEAYTFFMKMPPSHRHYYSRWIEEGKTEATRTKRIALAVTTMLMKMNFPEMLKWKKENDLPTR